MSCWNKEQLENMLEDVINELCLSDDAVQKHGPLGTAPSALVRLVLDEKDRKISMLEHGMAEIRIKKRSIHDIKSIGKEEQMELFKKLAPIARKGLDIPMNMGNVTAFNSVFMVGVQARHDECNFTFAYNLKYNSFILQCDGVYMAINQLALLIELRNLGYLSF